MRSKPISYQLITEGLWPILTVILSASAWLTWEARFPRATTSPANWPRLIKIVWRFPTEARSRWNISSKLRIQHSGNHSNHSDLSDLSDHSDQSDRLPCITHSAGGNSIPRSVISVMPFIAIETVREASFRPIAGSIATSRPKREKSFWNQDNVIHFKDSFQTLKTINNS